MAATIAQIGDGFVMVTSRALGGGRIGYQITTPGGFITVSAETIADFATRLQAAIGVAPGVTPFVVQQTQVQHGRGVQSQAVYVNGRKVSP